jgi:mannose-6-phosphate isomerase-like protein (cupin superfamily)
MGTEGTSFFDIRQIDGERSQAGKRYLEFLRLPALSAGLYVLPAGSTDSQNPHDEDEMYYVIRGRARMRVGEEDQAVSVGSVILVTAKAQHRFYDIQEELAVLVFFAPAES